MTSLPDLARWQRNSAGASETVAKMVLEHLPEGGTFVDVGANVGNVSRMVLDARNAKVIAFEPVPEYWEYCSDRLPEADVEPYALGECHEMRTLWCDGDNLGWNTFVTERLEAGMSPLEVQVIPFDDYAERLDSLDVVKIDVEGYEHAVLRGMRASLERWHPVLIVELGWGVHHPQRSRQVEAIEWMFSHGYRRIEYGFDGTKDVVLVP